MFIDPYRFDERLARCELLCNRADMIPIVSILSGGVRILAGIVQTVAGICFSWIELTYALLRDDSYRTVTGGGLYHTVHGMLNVLRGSVAIRWWTFPLLYLYDRYVGRLNYFYEPRNLQYYPLNRQLRS